MSAERMPDEPCPPSGGKPHFPDHTTADAGVRGRITDRRLAFFLDPADCRMLCCESCGNDVWKLYIARDVGAFLPVCTRCGYQPVAFTGAISTVGAYRGTRQEARLHDARDIDWDSWT